MLTILPESQGKVLALEASDWLTDDDYQRLVSEIERVVKECGHIRFYWRLYDFRGWTPEAAWDDFKVGMKHRHNVERIAMVGDRAWEQWIIRLIKPFTDAEAKYFDHSQSEEAWKWVEA